jgi:hypothetical protein
MTWRPIETAPDEGEFLAYDATSGKMDVCVKTETFGVCAVQCDGEYGPQDGEFGGHGVSITHWMPLPDPPTGEGVSAVVHSFWVGEQG